MVEGVLSTSARVFPLGAIAGDVIGSVHEHAGTKTADFPLFTPASRFTDDSAGRPAQGRFSWHALRPRMGFARDAPTNARAIIAP